jgi:hypothetical protein
VEGSEVVPGARPANSRTRRPVSGGGWCVVCAIVRVECCRVRCLVDYVLRGSSLEKLRFAGTACSTSTLLVVQCGYTLPRGTKLVLPRCGELGAGVSCW